MVVEVVPDNGRDFSAEELQSLIGGRFDLIEIKQRHQTMVILADEDRKRFLPQNFLAEALVNQEDVDIKGNALLCNLKELK